MAVTFGDRIIQSREYRVGLVLRAGLKYMHLRMDRKQMALTGKLQKN